MSMTSTTPMAVEGPTQVPSSATTSKTADGNHTAIVTLRNPFAEEVTSVIATVHIVGDSGHESLVSGQIDEPVLGPGELAVAVVPLFARQAEKAKKATAVAETTVDDDAVSIPVQRLWSAILAHRGESEFGNGHVHNVSELHDGLVGAFPGQAAAIEEIFVAHGYFADTAGGQSDRKRDPGERAGMSSYLDVDEHGSRDPRP